MVSCRGEIEQRGNHKDGLEKKRKKERTRFNQRGKFLNISINMQNMYIERNLSEFKLLLEFSWSILHREILI